MYTAPAPTEDLIDRQVFETWWIAIPSSFQETFVREGPYWHAWDPRRSVSLTSLTLWDGDDPVTTDAILAAMPPPDGTVVDELPEDLAGWAIAIDCDRDAPASRAITGMLVVDGRVLLATITADDLDWAREIWCTIRHRPVSPASRRDRRERPAPPVGIRAM